MTMTLEESFAALQKIAEQMESQNVSLEESIDLYEKGQGLIRHCETLLNEAQIKIDQATAEQA